MGTPDFAVPTLQELGAARHEICGVVTIPDKPAGRGRKLSESPVKLAAQELNIPILQPEKLKDPDFQRKLADWNADLFVVVAFRMLPESVWKMPPRGTVNLHASLLPDYRGAAPINHSIINGETETGATTFFIEKEIDTGQILLQYKTPIPADWNAGALHDHLSIAGAKLVVQTVDALEAGKLKAVQQEEQKAIHTAPKIFREHCKIDFTQPRLSLHNLVRGLSPYPAAWCLDQEKILKIYRTEMDSLRSEKPNPGKVIQEQGKIWVSASDGWLEIMELQAEGRKRLDAKSFLLGHSLSETLA